ncbi:MAG: hypothetical protein GY915_00740 [bacterium]|nr:hypothetical protein [bacterium]
MKIQNVIECLTEMRDFGLEWDKAETFMDKVAEELEEVREAALENNPEHLKEELGDLILTAIDLARYLGHDPSEALEISFVKLNARFVNFKRIIEEKGLDPKLMPPKDKFDVWKQAKKIVSEKGVEAFCDQGS